MINQRNEHYTILDGIAIGFKNTERPSAHEMNWRETITSDRVDLDQTVARQILDNLKFPTAVGQHTPQLEKGGVI